MCVRLTQAAAKFHGRRLLLCVDAAFLIFDFDARESKCVLAIAGASEIRLAKSGSTPASPFQKARTESAKFIVPFRPSRRKSAT
jgi:hypothetical protein